MKKSNIVSIPQAVSTIAIRLRCFFRDSFGRFNTASGKYYCNNAKSSRPTFRALMVSIPQAVSTIAMFLKGMNIKSISILSFNTASGKYYCNEQYNERRSQDFRFQYRKR